MSLFECEKCGAVENTASSNYWKRHIHEGKSALCSECDPEIGKWHNIFPKVSVKEGGYVTDKNGYLRKEK